MSDAFRIKVISTLIEEIALLTGGRFEQFGYRIMEIVYPAQWVERGTTPEGAPRGYTVDTSAGGASLVAEMSSEADYFHGDLEKPRRDLAHAISLHCNVKCIWLLSSRQASAGETTKCSNLITEFKQANPSLTEVEILDSRAIANQVFANLGLERFIDSLTGFLPSIGRLFDENAISHQVPKYPNYQPRPDDEFQIITRLTTSPCIVVGGISGIGKSALVAQVSEKLRPDFDAIIWCDASDLSNVSELSNIDILRSGTRHNISGFLRRHKCLLILDDATFSVNEIENIEHGESKVIITCQSTSDPNAFLVTDLDENSAQKVLEANVSVPCPSEVYQLVILNVGGYPLLLGALNRVAIEEGWEAVKVCCSDVVSSIEDERHQKVCQRILIRHREALASELEFVKWSGGSRFEAELAEICVSSRAIKNLQKRAFLSATSIRSIRVHDVVYKSISAVITVSTTSESTFIDRLDGFIRQVCESEKPVLRRIVNAHSKLLMRLLTSEPRSSFIYAVALARTGDTPLVLFGDPVVTATQIASYNNWDGKTLEIRAVIESVEAIYTITTTNNGSVAAKLSLEINIEALNILGNSPAATGDMLRDLKHHYAKMLIRLNKLSEAESEFRSILGAHPTFAAGRLQLCRILEKTGRKPEALDECKKIITQRNTALESVSEAVLLEILRLIATLGSPNDLCSVEQTIMTSLSEVREYDISLASRLIAAVAQKTWYTMPHLVTRMFESIDWREATPTSDPERFDWAQAHKAAAKVTNLSDPRRQQFLTTADETYNTIIAPKPYYFVHHAEVLILLERFGDANALLDRVQENNRDEFWWQRKAQALLGSGFLDLALEAINNGLGALRDDKYKAAFLHDRFRIKKSMNDPRSIDDLQDAINSLPVGDKYRNDLESKLATEHE